MHRRRQDKVIPAHLFGNLLFHFRIKQSSCALACPVIGQNIHGKFCIQHIIRKHFFKKSPCFRIHRSRVYAGKFLYHHFFHNLRHRPEYSRKLPLGIYQCQVIQFFFCHSPLLLEHTVNQCGHCTFLTFIQQYPVNQCHIILHPVRNFLQHIPVTVGTNYTEDNLILHLGKIMKYFHIFLIRHHTLCPDFSDLRQNVFHAPTILMLPVKFIQIYGRSHMFSRKHDLKGIQRYPVILCYLLHPDNCICIFFREIPFDLFCYFCLKFLIIHLFLLLCFLVMAFPDFYCIGCQPFLSHFFVFHLNFCFYHALYLLSFIIRAACCHAAQDALFSMFFYDKHCDNPTCR